ncbi:MAG: helix-turn-helix domain-containing protein [Actinomycetota bacterium]
MAEPTPLLVRPRDAAVMLGVTRTHIYQLIDRGELGRVELPGSRAIRIPLVDVYAAAGMEPPESTGHAGDAA